MPYITERTQVNYHYTMKAVDSYFGATSIGDITSADYQRIILDYGKDHAHETARKFHHHLKACFDYAFRNGVIKKDPTFSAAKVVGKQSDKKVKYLSEADMNKLMHQVLETTTLDNTANYILILANATGMRIGEILGLTFGDVDIANQVKVDKVTCSYLAEIVDDRRSLCKTSDKNVDGFIFINRNTFKPISWTMVNKVLTRHCERAGVPRITTHAFRHTHISYLLNNDVYEQYVSERVGHADTTMIRRVYGHVLDELKAKSDDKVIHLLDMQKSSASH